MDTSNAAGTNGANNAATVANIIVAERTSPIDTLGKPEHVTLNDLCITSPRKSVARRDTTRNANFAFYHQKLPYPASVSLSSFLARGAAA
jgi:hypothetical protein